MREAIKLTPQSLPRTAIDSDPGRVRRRQALQGCSGGEHPSVVPASSDLSHAFEMKSPDRRKSLQVRSMIRRPMLLDKMQRKHLPLAFMQCLVVCVQEEQPPQCRWQNRNASIWESMNQARHSDSPSTRSRHQKIGVDRASPDIRHASWTHTIHREPTIQALNHSRFLGPRSSER